MYVLKLCTVPSRVTLPTWGSPPPCKQALKPWISRNLSTRPLIWMFPWEVYNLEEQNLSSSSGKAKKNKIKRSGRYLDLDNGGIRMTDFDVILKALKLTWIPRLLWISDNSDWCIIPKHSFRSKGGLNFLLR